MIEKILLADSGTGQSEEMFKALASIPSMQRASVTILHVVPPQVTAAEMDEQREKGGQILANAIQALDLDSTRVSGLLREGDPKDVVCKVADEIDADLIIMGSRGLQRLVSILENSVSQYVFQLSSHPMLLVRDDIYIKKINRVMVALDKSEAASQSLKLALFLLRDLKGAELILTHIVQDLSGKSYCESGEVSEHDPVFATAVAEAKRLGIAYRCLSCVGKPAEELCRLADELNVGLLLLGSPDRRPTVAKGLPDLDRLLGTSLSDYVRVHANCPVLLARTS
ncbi:universal stress protein [Stenomitos frigidus]|uniref:Universal stress protein n=1 Tax=Stenomitos frigidus ULC18 TaxID=2107698 RepID=A0A2T1DZ69_9CYAN|nr:universal stress protein [Stenomitos frigidus]PSB25674.1 universal stress protein [Stenomitos frigidus ULC18]